MTTLTRDELLTVLIEEAAEIIQAATKCQRFGFDRNWPGYGVNRLVLATEIGELLAVIDALQLDDGVMIHARSTKIDKVEKWKAHAAANPVKS